MSRRNLCGALSCRTIGLFYIRENFPSIGAIAYMMSYMLNMFLAAI